MNIEYFLATHSGLFWICIIVPALFALAGVFITRVMMGREHAQGHHNMANAIIGPIATIFGILGAFIVATTWNQYATTAVNINQEAQSLHSLYLNAEAFSPEFCKDTRALCLLYRKAVLQHEWKIIDQETDTLAGNEVLKNLFRLYTSYQIKNNTELAFFQLNIQCLCKLKDLRQQRLDDASTGLLPLLWILFLLGGIILVMISFIMINSSAITHATMVMLIAIVIGAMIYAIISLDFPFVGPAEISKKPFLMIMQDDQGIKNPPQRN